MYLSPATMLYHHAEQQNPGLHSTSCTSRFFLTSTMLCRQDGVYFAILLTLRGTLAMTHLWQELGFGQLTGYVLRQHNMPASKHIKHQIHRSACLLHINSSYESHNYPSYEPQDLEIMITKKSCRSYKVEHFIETQNSMQQVQVAKTGQPEKPADHTYTLMVLVLGRRSKAEAAAMALIRGQNLMWEAWIMISVHNLVLSKQNVCSWSSPRTLAGVLPPNHFSPTKLPSRRPNIPHYLDHWLTTKEPGRRDSGTGVFVCSENGIRHWE